MLIESLAVGIIILFLRGKLGRYLEAIQFKGLWLPIAAFILEWASGVFLGKLPWILSWTGLIEAVVYGLLMAFLWLNRRHRGFLIACTGLFLNALVVCFNRGFMPVDGEALRHFGFLETYDTLKQMQVFGHQLMTETTPLKFLGDVIHIQPPYPMPKSVSIGDLILGVGIGLHLALYKDINERH